MNIKKLSILSFLVSLLLISTDVFAQVDARMLRQPDVSQSKIVFSYADDIWIVNKDGGTAHRLTTASGQETFPRFSPDGSMVAYNANYDGNTDIYVIPANGGVPRRITHHPMTERVLGWYPDGKHILFASSMKSGRQRYNQFYKVSINGGLSQRLPVPYGEFGSISPDGKTIAYTPKSRVFRNWKRYRGGWATDIWTFNLEDNSSKQITTNNANDELPMWDGSTLYFMSDRGSKLKYNLWAYNSETGKKRQVTNFSDYDIHFPAIGPSDIVFEAGGDLYLMDLASEQTRQVSVDVITDQTSIKPHTENVSSLIQNASISPEGNRALFQARGDIFSVPAENGYIQNLTQSSGVADRFPAWSPDGKYVAYWNDKTGEYELVLQNVGSGETQTVTSTGKKFKYNLYWSPDSKKLVYVNNAMDIRMYNVDSKSLTDIDKGLWMYQGQLDNFSVSWSADSKWVAYSRGIDNRKNAIFLYNTNTKKTNQVTSGYYNDRDPAFDPDGKYLYFLSSRTLRPNYSDLQNTWIYANTTNVVAVPLRKDVDSPLAPRNDEVSIKKEEKKEEKENGKKQKPKTVNIDLSNFESRLVQLPVDAGNYSHLSAASAKVLYQRNPRTGSDKRGSELAYFDLKERKEQSVIDNINGYQLSADNKKVLVASHGKYDILDLKPGQKIEKPLATDDLTMTVNPQKEWQQIFNDVWRFYRDYFYDPNMHGVDWKAMKARYQKMLDDAATRSDVNFVIGELIAELNSSHTYDGGGDTEHAEHRGVGLLGVDWSLENGAYRIKNIVEAAPWDNEARSPLDESGVNISEGDYVLAVNGTTLDTSKDPYAAFQGMADQTVELTVNDEPTMKGARKVLVKTLSSETRLRHLAWVQKNRKRVEEATNGRVGYIYVPNTSIGGQTELVRQFMDQYNKDALIIDERFNSGGQIPDRFIELLNRTELARWAVRDGHDWQSPPQANVGPKVMLINGWSGSGGDAFPAFFKEENIGPLVGTRTWGGLIGYTGVPSLIDGGFLTVPSFRMYYPDGKKWFPEGHGVEPDVKVIDNPTKLANGTDPQLERAIDLIMDKLDKEKKVTHPPYEDRSGTGIKYN